MINGEETLKFRELWESCVEKKDLKRMALLGLAAGLALGSLPIEGEAGVTSFIANQCGAACNHSSNPPKSTGQDAQGYYIKPGDQSQPVKSNPQQDQNKQDNTK